MLLSDLKGIGPSRLNAFHAAGICSLRDLLYELPVRYRDTTNVVSVAEAKVGDRVTLELVRASSPALFRKGKLTRVTCRFSDDSGELSCVWFNQVWMKNILETKTKLMLSGQVEVFGGKKQLTNPSIETEPRIIPLYRPLEGVPQKIHEKAVAQALEYAYQVAENELPDSLRERLDLMKEAEAIRILHHPTDADLLQNARRTFAFTQMLLYQTAVRLSRDFRGTGPSMVPLGFSPESFWASQPFKPTGAQERTLEEIAKDLAGPRAMARMVQGDVGSGKTAVAKGAILLAAASGYQSAMMVPTEILARQHYAEMKDFFEKNGFPCALLVGGMSPSERKRTYAGLASGEIRVAIGTHALISPGVKYERLGLCITDEQHRFGVGQRTKLINKGTVDGETPHLLVMSATPIPRSLALVMYGDLDISLIDELPPGRFPVITRLVPEEKRSKMYSFLRDHLEQGRQVYIVCPLVEGTDGEEGLKSVKKHWEELSATVFSGFQTGLTYGSQPPQEKADTLSAFAAGRIRLLFSTTVIEVGVNVPNAAIMVIENADRYGLAQLHQLRGRVGRGTEQSWCFLMASPNDRLRTLVSTNDGFKVAEADLEQRGPGELLGTHQSGCEMLPGGTAAFGSVEWLYEAADCVREIFGFPGHEDELAALSERARILVENLNGKVSIS